MPMICQSDWRQGMGAFREDVKESKWGRMFPGDPGSVSRIFFQVRHCLERNSHEHWEDSKLSAQVNASGRPE